MNLRGLSLSHQQPATVRSCTSPFRHPFGKLVKRCPARHTRRKPVNSIAPSQESETSPSILDIFAEGPLDRMGAKKENLPDPKDQDPAGEVEVVEVAPGQKGEVIRVDDNFEAVEGLRLTPSLIVGKEIGGGAQGAVYDLKRADGSDPKMLLKVMKYKGANLLTGADIGLRREWLIGQALNQLRLPSGQLPGFVRTGAALATRSNDMEGLLMEKANGMPVDKRLAKDPEWADAPYCVEMCRQVFAALDLAWRELGFRHRDMRVANILEHRPEGDTFVLPKGYSDHKQRLYGLLGADSPNTFKLPGDKKKRELQFKVIDMGHARLLGHKTNQKLPQAPVMEKMYRRIFQGKGDVWRFLQDLSDKVDGRTFTDDQYQDVMLLRGLVHEVTGVKINAFFRPSEQRGKELIQYPVSYKQPLPWQKQMGFGHGIRRFLIRVKAYVLPRNTNYSPTLAIRYIEERDPEQAKKDLGEHDGTNHGQ